nr:unnamed protein product [Callosobruchus chinensis]
MSIKLCLNCLRAGHFNRSCRLPTCKKCHAKHNILLHVDRTPESDSTQPKRSEVSAVHSASSSVSNVLLPTVCVGVYDKDKNKHTVRVLLDSGAQSSFMTEELCNRLKIHKEKVSSVVNGISDSQMNVAYRTEVNIFSSSNNFDINLTCFVLPKITSVLPKHKIDVSQLNIPDIIKLADPCFSEPQKIDMLIGSDVFWNIVSTEQTSLGHNLPVLQNTKFGWIISGPLGFSSKNSIVCNFSTEIDIQNDLRRFWEIEECLSDQKVLSEEEIACEKHFVENTKRNLAHENRDKYPKIAKMIETDFYVDDLLTGCDTVEDLKQMSKLIHEILNQGCFKLRKFYSNNSEVLDSIVDNDGLSKIVNFNESDTAKTLGLMWCPSSDKLIYSVKPFPEDSHVTKREISSGSSKNFDPLGLISPCIIQVKILLQGLWLENVSWDDPLPSHIVSKWNEFKTDILSLNELSIDRHAFCKNMKSFELHIFSDSSEKAYGACIYVKTVDNFDNTSVNLLTAKARLAPLKSITIPRLELCGALLAARLTEKVSKALQVENIKRTFWMDSTIVLGWLKSARNKLKTFVRNRVSEIQNLTTLDKWRHVPSEFNPADLVSRGIKPSDIQGTNLWWYGP